MPRNEKQWNKSQFDFFSLAWVNFQTCCLWGIENKILKKSADISGNQVGFGYKNSERNPHRGCNVRSGTKKCSINICFILKNWTINFPVFKKAIVLQELYRNILNYYIESIIGTLCFPIQMISMNKKKSAWIW